MRSSDLPSHLGGCGSGVAFDRPLNEGVQLCAAACLWVVAGGIIYDGFSRGDIAQLGERGVRNAEVGGSSPPISTKTYTA